MMGLDTARMEAVMPFPKHPVPFFIQGAIIADHDRRVDHHAEQRIGPGLPPQLHPVTPCLARLHRQIQQGGRSPAIGRDDLFAATSKVQPCYILL
jgi:hypothetical protein